ncbi:hypothetical protein [Niallia endozanthoxylica]|uniref:hypothetical protein n=1 Tax=Niallia endozanthoxylica TaxID=2036016 RepID=UPI001CC3C11B|nr:hypothetical protein [Niallia endozanthoxylica]
MIGLEVEDEDGMLDANIRWDGLMEIHLQSITEENNEWKDTIHTYDIDALITKLNGLRQVCFDHFDNWKER